MEMTSRTRWLGFFAVLTATIMNLLDSSIVNIAAPSIRADLGGSYALLQWTVTAYTLALGVGLLTGGRLGDMYGRRPALLIGTAGFVLASLACGFAWSPGALIGARAIQGLFGAVMVPQVFGLIRDLFPPDQIGKAFGALGPVIGVSTVLGPVVAGLLIDVDLAGTGWRSVFLINIPLGAFTIIAGARTLPAGRRNRDLRLDWVGALIAGAGMFLLVYPLVQGREKGWPGWSFGMLGAAVVVLAGFVLHQSRRRRSGRTPLVELGVLARRSYSSGVIFVIVFFGSIVGLTLALGLFLQLGLGYSPVRASLSMVTWAFGAFLGSGFGATMMGRLGRKILHLGLALMAVGLVGLTATLLLDGTATRAPQLLLPLGVYGFGMGMIFVPLFDVIMGEVRDHEVGSASSLLESLQQLGSSLGVAALGTVFFARVGARPALGDFDHAVTRIAVIALGLTALAFALAYLLPRKARAHEFPQSEPALVPA
jgi:EmrB/QacA subfamily drug resistance transporter